MSRLKWLEDVENDLLEPEVKRMTQKVSNRSEWDICHEEGQSL
jgi:hypothetical protein